jgi:hypothetical protein
VGETRATAATANKAITFLRNMIFLLVRGRFYIIHSEADCIDHRQTAADTAVTRNVLVYMVYSDRLI